MGVRHFITWVLDGILPNVCVCCESPVLEYGLCSDCFIQVTPITNPLCLGCGYPFQNRMDGVYCGVCLKSKPPCVLRSAVLYDDTTSRMILSLKYGDNIRAIDYMGTHMVRALQSGISESDIQTLDYIMPVPLHYKRFWRRKYNQSALLGRTISKRLGIPLCTTAIRRTHFIAPQGGKSLSARYKNVRNSFQVVSLDAVVGKTILLVDDVYTSGATLHTISHALLKAGATKIYGITYARALRQ